MMYSYVLDSQLIALSCVTMSMYVFQLGYPFCIPSYIDVA